MVFATGNALLDGLIRRSADSPDDAAVVDCGTGRTLSSAVLDEVAEAAAAHLRDLGVRADDYVIVTAPLSIEFVAYCFGAFKLGAVPALLDSSMSLTALEQCLDELDARVWITPGPASVAFRGVVEAPRASTDRCRPQESPGPPSRDVLDPVLMLYTSGTTGVPKGVPWTSRELASQIALYRDPAIATEFCLFPHLALVAIAMGRTAVLPHLASTAPAKTNIEELHRQLLNYGGDYMFASPLMWQRLAGHIAAGHTAPPIKKAATAGSAVSSRLVEELMALMPDTRFTVPYASTEVLMPISLIAGVDYVYHSGIGTWAGRGVPLGIPAHAMSIGVVDPDMQSDSFAPSALLAAGEVGEIVVTGARATTTYFKRPEVQAHAKMRDQHTGRVWHRTADIGYIDHNAMLWYLCRKKDIVDIGGTVLYPDAIEAMFNQVTGAPLSAAVYDPTSGDLCYVMAEADAPQVIDSGTLATLAARVGLPAPRVVLLPHALAADPRHNSKIDRAVTLSQVLALHAASAS